MKLIYIDDTVFKVEDGYNLTRRDIVEANKFLDSLDPNKAIDLTLNLVARRIGTRLAEVKPEGWGINTTFFKS